MFLMAFLAGNMYAQCDAGFSTATSSCQFNTVGFTFTGSAGKPKFYWNFGDGFSNFNTDTLPNPSHRFDRDGIFTITLIVVDTGGCSDTVSKNIRILKKPVASFTVTQACADLGTQFTSTSTADSTDTYRTFLWLFGDGGTDYVINPNHTYTTPGTKTVTLYITTWNGCMDTIIYSLLIRDRITLSVNKDTICKGEFINFSINPGSGTPGTYLWNFGDGFSSYSQNTSHQFNTAGTFTPSATLYYTGGATCTKTLSKSVKINELPDASFTILDSVQCFSYNSVCIKTKPNNPPLTFRSLSFDDGYVDNTTPLNDSIICYSYSDSMGGRYTLSMDVTDRNGCRATYTSPAKLQIYPEIEAFFLASEVVGCFETPITAINRSNMSPPRVTNFRWEFGDDSVNTTTWSPITHTYTKDGSFRINLIIQNSDGCIDTFTRDSIVTNTSYLVDARMDTALSVCRSTNLFQFRQTPVTDVHIYWDFNNFDTAFTYDPDYHYPEPGIYYPTAHLTKNSCPKIVYLDTVFVYGPQAGIGNIANRFQCSIRDTVILNNTSIYYNNRPSSLKYFWDVGDMFASSCVSDSINNSNVGINCRYSVDSSYIRHMYSPGREACYFARLIVSDTVVGCSDTAIASVPLMRPNASTGLRMLLTDQCLGPETYKAVRIDLTRTLPGCGQEKFWVMWDSACAAASSKFNSYWREGDTIHNYDYDMCDSSGKITVGLILQNGLESNDSACRDTAFYHYILDYGKVNPHFSTTYNPTVQYCKNSTFTFTIKDTIQDSLDLIQWTWGDGTVEAVNDLLPINHTFKKAGVYRVALLLKLKDGCIARDTMMIRVGYTSSFSIADKELCLGDSLHLTKSISYWNSTVNYWNDSSRSAAGLESIKWDFGDGNGFSSTGLQPNLVYSKIGNFTIRLAITDSAGCKDTVTIVNGVRVFGINTSFTSLKDTFTCAQLISFKSDVTVYDSANMFGHADDRVVKYTWSFGKGLSNSILKNPTKFFKAGDYTIKLLNENTRNCKDSFVKSIVVLGPTAWFDFVGDSTGCQGVSVTMKNKSIFANSYTWTFGDASNSSQFTFSDTNMTFKYLQYGKFYPKLTAFTNMISNGLPVTCSNTYPDTSFKAPYREVTVFENPKPLFTHITNCKTFQTAFTNLTVLKTDSVTRYEWDFGDGDTSMQFSPTHNYNDTGRYLVTLKAYSLLGCSGVYKNLVIIAPYPVVYFQTTSICLGTPIHFKDSTDAFNDQVKQWSWNFDDGTTSLLRNPIKVYTYDSIFNVSLTVTNYAGCKASDTIQINVHGRPGTNFKFNSACAGQNIIFTNTTTSKEFPLKYAWWLGEGDTSSATSPVKLFNDTGVYKVKLKATNPFGCVDSITKIVSVYALPKAAFTINLHNQCQKNSPFIFTNNSTIDSGLLSYSWNFGDTIGSSLKNPIKYFKTAGGFKVSLEAITSNDCRDTAYDTVYVNPIAAAQPYLPNGNAKCINTAPFQFVDSSKIIFGTYTRKWDFGDNTGSTNSPVSHQYADTGNFTVKLITLSNRNCVDTAFVRMRVHPKPKAAFSINSAAQCQNTNQFVFTNTSTGYYGTTGSRWYFGDGDSSYSKQGSHHYKTHDTFFVRLVATNNSQCRDTVMQSVLVNPVPKTQFDINDSITCALGNLFLFDNLSTIAFGSMKYKWDFGDNKTDSIIHTRHTYDSAGIYSVRLITLSNAGCRDTLQKNIEVFRMPKAAFSVNDYSQCLNQQDFIFTNQSRIVKDSLSMRWLLGENDLATTLNARKQFKTDGIFKVTLRATSKHGCIDSVSKNLRVHPRPQPAFTINDSTQCINNQNFIFNNISSIRQGSFISLWQIDNGITSSQNPLKYTFKNFGNHLVKLTLTSDSGCIDSLSKPVEAFPKPVSAISSNDSTQCISTNRFALHAIFNIPYGQAGQYFWNIDNNGYATGSADTIIHYTQTGPHTIGLIVESKEKCRDTSALNILVYPKPKAAFIINDSAQCANDNLFRFTNQSIFASGPLSYLWNFGNGTTDTAASPQKTFIVHDTFRVSLIASTAFACRDTFSSAIIVFPKPVAAFAINDSTQCFPGNLMIPKNNSTIPYGQISYNWSSGDGYVSTKLDTGYGYKNPGTYLVGLILTSSEGCIDSVKHSHTVYPQPLAGFNINKTSQCLNTQSFIYTNSSSISSGTLTYQWTFGDGNQSSDKDPVYRYLQHGAYKVGVKVISNFGCIDSASKSVRVLAKPAANFSLNNTERCVSIQRLNFNSNASIAEGKILKYYWDFDDGVNDSGISVSHFFNYSRFYNIRHVVISDSLCSDTNIQRVRIFPIPKAAFSINDTAQCLRPNAFIFTDQSYDSFGIQTFDWDLEAGAAATTPTVNHHYTDTGYKTVRLIVSSINGCKDTARRQVYVKRMPDPSFTKLAVQYCQFDPKVTLVPKETGGTFYGKNISGVEFNPLLLWRDTIKYGITVNGCYDSSLQFTNVFPAPKINLGNDTQLCLYEILDLKATTWNATYKWLNSAVTDSQFTVSKPGVYIVTVSNVCGIARDTIRVTYSNSNCRFFMPNAFSPNGDEHNAFFKPYTINVPEISMQIYNRWGERIYDGDQNSPGWDGTYQGEPVQQDVYIWVVFYRYPLSNKWIQIKEKGTVQLLR